MHFSQFLDKWIIESYAEHFVYAVDLISEFLNMIAAPYV